MDKRSYIFVENFNNKREPESIHFFYQICTFGNPQTGKYEMRKYAINEKDEFVDIKEYNLTKKQYKKFISTRKQHEYKAYPAYSLIHVNHASMGDVLMAKSDILATSFDYYGFAPF